MIEFTARERHHGHAELAQFGVVEFGVGTQGSAKVGIEVV